MPRKIPLIHLENGLFLQVDGEDEKQHTISWDILRQIGDNTQYLIKTLAQYSLENTALDINSIKLDFVGFFPGSAIPEFKMRNEVQTTLFNSDKLYQTLNADFTFVASHLRDGNFQAIADRYTEPSVKNEIVEAVYEFSNSAGTKPFRIVKRNPKSKNGFKAIAKIRTITPTVRNLLKVKVPYNSGLQVIEQSFEAISKVLIKPTAHGSKTKRIGHLYMTQKGAALSLGFDSIETDKRIYLLKSEILFKVDESKKHVSLENSLLDIYANGTSREEAEQDLSEQFDYTYQRLTKIEDEKLSEHLLNAKKYILLLVDSVKEK